MKSKSSILFLIVVLLSVVSLAAVLLRPTISVLVRNRLKTSLAEHFQGRLTFSDFRFSVFPIPAVTVTDLKVLHRDRIDLPPLIQVAQVSIRLHWSGVLGPRLHIARATLQGLQVTFPPQGHAPPSHERSSSEDLAAKYPVVVDHIDATDAVVKILRAQPEKRPLVFQVHRVEMNDATFAAPAEFEATLTNAVPRGEIHVHGTFGPWDSQRPRETVVRATYEFRNADLSTINGLQGTLSSQGTIAGPLECLDVGGSTLTPDFTLRRVGNPIELRTNFSATVDATNGNTYLHSIDAHFLHSTLFITGEVVDLDSNIRGRTIDLDTQSNDVRAEDLIRLAVRTERPVLRGPVRLRAKIRIPEADRDLSERLEVLSQFTLWDGHFSNSEVQDKVDLLSRKGQGEPRNLEIAHVPSQLVATMHSKNAVIGFPWIQFRVPGAQLQLAGSYTLGPGNLDFNGELDLDAKLSQTMTGAKSLLLKAIDPFFRGKNGGARIPVRVLGTKDRPIFGLGHEKTAKHPSLTAPETSG